MDKQYYKTKISELLTENNELKRQIKELTEKSESYEIDITTSDRIEYLKSEIAHGNYHDGWTLEGLKEHLKELEEKSNPLQLELFDE